MRRSILSAVLATVLAATAISPAAAVSANISPYSQTHSHGVKAQWTLTWGNYAPYDVDWDYGDGASASWYNASFTSKTLSRSFWPCTSTTYYQGLAVHDAQGGWAYASSWAREYGGNPC